MPGREQVGGYSLYELVGTIAVVAVVLSLGIPSFGHLVAEHRQRVAVDALFHAIYLARKESIVRRREVTLCPSADGEQCLSGSDWSAGYILFANVDRDSPARRDPGEPLIRRWITSSHNLIVANRLSFSFRSTALRATNGTFILCDKSRRAAARALIVSYTGRPRVRRFEDQGSPRQCADYVKLNARI